MFQLDDNAAVRIRKAATWVARATNRALWMGVLLAGLWSTVTGPVAGGAAVPDTRPPSVRFTHPTDGGSWSTSADTVTLWVECSDDIGVASVTWDNRATGADGTATQAGSTTWKIGPIQLAHGRNWIGVGVLDPSNRRTEASLLVTRTGDRAPGPVVTGVVVHDAEGTYHAGELLRITVTFDRPVLVTEPGCELVLETGETDRVARYSEGSGAKALTLEYLVTAGDSTRGLQYKAADSLRLLRGGAIRDESGLDADLMLPAVESPYSLAGSRTIVIDGDPNAAQDTSPPTVARVYGLWPNGTFTVGRLLMLAVQFSEPLVIGGAPVLILETGTVDRTSAYYYLKSSNTLVFTYVVQAGDVAADLDYRDPNSLSLNGGSLTDALGNAAILTLPQPGAPGSLADANNYRIDTRGPLVFGVQSATPNGTLRIGSPVEVVVQWNEPAYVTGSPQLLLELGAFDRPASYVSGSGTNSLRFGYIVQAGDASPDLDYASSSSLTLNGGTIQDAPGNAANLALPAPGTAGSLSANAALVVDTSASSPTIPAGWRYRLSFTAKSDSVSGAGTLTNIPLCLVLDSAAVAVHGSVFANAKADGSDLRVTDADNVLLPIERVSYDPAAKRAEVWLRASVLSKAVNRFYLYYGNPTATAATAGVWTDYTAVFHMDDDPALRVLRDSSPAGAHATASAEAWGDAWQTGDRVQGKVGRYAWAYDGDGVTAINNAAVSITDHSWTVGGWVYHDINSTDFFLQAKPNFFQLCTQASDNSRYAQWAGSYCGVAGGYDLRWFNAAVDLRVWTHYVWVYDRGAMTLYKNGTPRTMTDVVGRGVCTQENITSCPTCPTGDQRTPVGVFGPSELCPSCSSTTLNDKLHGRGDEFQLSGQVRSAEFVQTSFWNQRNPLTYYTFGAQEDLGGGTPGCSSQWPPRRALALYNGSPMSNALRDSIAERFEFSLEGVASDIAYMVGRGRKYQGFYTYLSLTDATDGSSQAAAMGEAGTGFGYLHFGGPCVIDVDGPSGPAPQMTVKAGDRIPAFTYVRHLLNFSTPAARNALRSYAAGLANTPRSGVYPLGMMWDNAMRQAIWPVQVVSGTALVAEAPAGSNVLKSPAFLTWWWDQGVKVFMQEWMSYVAANRNTVFGGRVVRALANMGETPYIGGAIRIPQNPPLGHDWLNAYVAGAPIATILEQEFAYTPSKPTGSAQYLPESIYNRHTEALADGASVWLTGYTSKTDPSQWDVDLEGTVASYWCSRPWDGGGTSTPTVYLTGTNSWTPAEPQFHHNLKGLLDVDLGQPLGPPSAVLVDPGNCYRVYRRDFACGMVLVRYKECSNANVTVPLGGTFFPLDVHGRAGAGVTQWTLAPGSGKVFRK